MKTEIKPKNPKSKAKTTAKNKTNTSSKTKAEI